MRHGGKGSEVDAGAHAVGTPEFDVVGVVVGLEQSAVVVGVPRGNTVVDTALGQGIHPLQPCCIAGDLPVAKDLHDAAELTVGGCGAGVIDRALRNRTAEIHMPAIVHGAHEFQIAQGAFKLGEEMRQSLSIVPDMRARSVTAAGVGKTAFPSPHIAVCLAENGGRLEDREVGGDSIEHVSRKRGTKDRVFELDGPGTECGVVLLNVCSHIASVLPLG